MTRVVTPTAPHYYIVKDTSVLPHSSICAKPKRQQIAYSPEFLPGDWQNTHVFVSHIHALPRKRTGKSSFTYANPHSRPPEIEQGKRRPLT